MPKNKRPAVYSIAHPSSTKVYVGSSIDVNRRWRSHRKDLELKRHRCSHLQRAWIKHGGEGFVFMILEECNPIKEQLLACEQRWMDHYKPTGLYNSCPVAGSALGLKLTIEQRQKISVALKGKPKSEGHRASLKEAWKTRDRELTEQQRFARGNGLRGKEKTPEHLTKIGASISATVNSRSENERQRIYHIMSVALGTPVTINGTLYHSHKAAATALSMTKHMFRKFLRQNIPDSK